MKAMKCENCGGAVEYAEDARIFECTHCYTKYEVSAEGRVGVAWEEILRHMSKTALMAEEERLNKKIASVQQKIDLKRMELDDSKKKYLPALAIGLMALGVLIALSSLSNISRDFGSAFTGLLFGGGMAVVGWFLLKYYRKRKASDEDTITRLEKEELEPLRKKLAEVRNQLDRK